MIPLCVHPRSCRVSLVLSPASAYKRIFIVLYPKKGPRIARLHLTNHNRPNSTATPVGLRPWHSSKKVELLEEETGLPPARKPSPFAMGLANRIPCIKCLMVSQYFYTETENTHFSACSSSTFGKRYQWSNVLYTYQVGNIIQGFILPVPRTHFDCEGDW